MIFKYPYLLLLIPVTLLLAMAARSLAGGRLAAIKLPVAVAPRASLKTSLFRFLPFWARTLALLLVIIALARPQKVEKGELPPTEGIDIMMCLDTSFSMSALDFNPYDRLDAAKKAAEDFIKKRTNDRIGLVIFGGVPALACPLTMDYQSLMEFLSTAYINMTKADGTAIGDAIMTAVNHIKDSKAKSRIIILLTDGRSNTGTINDPVIAAKSAAAFGIKIYTIGTATKGQAKIPTGNPFQPYALIQDDLDEATLLEIAGRTGGEFYRAENYSELQKIYDTINSLEKTKFEVKNFSSYTDLYSLFLWPAMAIFLVLFVLERTYLRTIP